MVNGWVLTKVDSNDAQHRPLVASLATLWTAGCLPLPGTEWMLCHVRCHPDVVAFMRQDEDFVWIGSGWSKPPQQLLDAYASLIDPNETYASVGQVLDKLSESNPRFLMKFHHPEPN